MARNLFSNDEVILCAYAAMYDENDLGGIKRIAMIGNRTEASVQMKIQNIVAMFEHNNVEFSSQYKPLSGVKQGAAPRATNWVDIQPYLGLSRSEFRRKCADILSRS